MILNVIKDNEIDNSKIHKEECKELQKVELKKIKELLNEQDLRYVSLNVRQLLGIKKENDSTCFMMSNKTNTRRVVGSGERFRVILYIRLSQEDGDIEDGDVSGSIKNQLLYLLDECKKRDFKVVGIFCEEDISGVDDNRPEWLKSIRFAEVGNTEIVVCKSQSRFTRSMEMVEKYLHKLFPEWNVRFLGLVDNSDTNIVEGKKSRQINGLVNEWFVEDTSINTRATLKSMKQNGQFTGAFAPYGYKVDPKDRHHLVPDPYAKEAVVIMAGMMKHGKSPKEICEVLMRKQFLTPADYKRAQGFKIGGGQIKSIRYQIEKGDTLESIAEEFYLRPGQLKAYNDLKTNILKEGQIIEIPHRQKWKPRMIREILTDETQIGTLVQGKQRRISYKSKRSEYLPKENWIRVPHCHEANLDLETFNIVSNMFVTKRRTRTQKDGKLPLFSKKVYCACCGKPMNKNISSSKGIRKEYLCCKSNHSIEGHICDNRKSIELSGFTKYVLDCINDKIAKYYELSKLSDEYYMQNIYENIDKDIKVIEKDKDKIKLSIDDINNILVELYKDKVDGNLTVEEFNIIKRSNQLELESLKNKLNDLDQKQNNLLEEKEKQRNKIEIFEKYKDIEELNRVVLDTFINKIEVGKENKETGKREILIDWNFYAK